MKLRSFLVTVLLVISAAAAVADTSAEPAKSSPSSPAAPAIEPGKFHALLVGCTKYDNLKPEKSLHGPANDVALVRRFFTENLHLPADAITVLSETEAKKHGETSRPTYANIEREIKKLIDEAHEGDQVVLILAGHGGQQPEQKMPDPDYQKPDGMDQMFLPCDCGQWNGKKWCVDRSIPDYQLRTWCKQITAKKARLWVVLDCCCSGWTLRGDSPEVSRSVSTDELGVPDDEIKSAKKIAAARQSSAPPPGSPATRGVTRGAGGDDEATADFGPQSPDYVGLYAAQRDESELEMPMPYDSDNPDKQKVQGLLTYAIVDILSHASHPITYGELANLVRQRYPQWGRTTGPTPIVEGLAQNREVLGVERWPGRSNQRWQKIDTDLSANEGTVQGLTPDSIIALHPSSDAPNPESVLCYAKVTDSALLNSDLKLIDYNDVKVPRKSALPDGGNFEVVWTDCGNMRIKVGVDPQPIQVAVAGEKSTVTVEPVSPALQKIAADLKPALSSDASLCEFVENPHAAGWVVQKRDGKLLLISKDAAEIRGPLPEDAARFAIDAADPVPSIVRNMSRIARAQNLLNLTVQQAAQAAASGGSFSDSSQPNVELKLLRFKSKTDREGVEIDLKKGPLTLVAGDYVGWQMTNKGKVDAAVSLLYVDAGFGIQAIYPRPGSGADNILTRSGGTLTTKPCKITAKPIGNEHVVLVAVPRQAGRQAPDFSFLEQESLPLSRGADNDDNAALVSPLGRLLKNAMYGEGGTRGVDNTDAAESQLLLQSWRVTDEAN